MYPTWADILASNIPDIKYYNFGCAGAGNQFIFCKIQEADITYKFTDRDLVLIQWTNIRREDRYSEILQQWLTPGNLYTQTTYPEDYVYKFSSDTHCAVRDYSLIYSTIKSLQGRTNFKCVQMANIFEHIDQYSYNTQSETVAKVQQLYKPELNDHIGDNFYDVLWSGDITNKVNKTPAEFCPGYTDYHPTIVEHALFVEHAFDIVLSPHVKENVRCANQYYRDKVVQYLETESPFDQFTTTHSDDLETHVYSLFSESLISSSNNIIAE